MDATVTNISPATDHTDHFDEGSALSLLASIHTKVEHVLYEVMLSETRNAGTTIGAFEVGQLMNCSGIRSENTVRQARTGLLEKKSIERQRVLWGHARQPVVYTVFSPDEILIRRRTAGLPPFVSGLFDGATVKDDRAQTLVGGCKTDELSPREIQVAMQCSEGLSNADIAKALFIQEETVKFHLRNIFVKLGVKRRTELMALLFQRERASF